MEQLLPFIGIPIFFVAFLLVYRYLLPHLSGWKALAEHYGTERRASSVMGRKIHFGQIKVGSLRFKNLVKGYVTDRGLFLTQYLFIFGRQPNLLIPWEAFHAPIHRQFLFLRSVKLGVGTPVVTFLEMPKSIYEQFAKRIEGKY